jgi:predicted MFS family arabinose efflux permease
MGLLTAAYLVAFGAFQLPLGVLLDRYGPRRVEAALLLIAAAGALLFARAHSLAGLIAGRALIGLGVSACLMAAFKAFVGFFPAGRLPLVNGLQLASGGLGALAATAPLEWGLHLVGWRLLFLLLAGLTLLAALLVWLLVPGPPPAGKGPGMAFLWRGMGEVLGSRRFWRLAPLVTASQATFMALQGLWAGAWLRDVAGLPRTAAASVLLMIAAAMTAGYLLLGALTERLGRAGVPPRTVAVWGMGGFILLQAAILALPRLDPRPCWLLFGLLGTSGTIAYADLTQRFPAALAGRVNTALNLVVFAGAFAAQWGIGVVIGRFAASGAPIPLAGFRAGFGLMLALQAAGLLWFRLAPTEERSGAALRSLGDPMGGK